MWSNLRSHCIEIPLLKIKLIMVLRIGSKMDASTLKMVTLMGPIAEFVMSLSLKFKVVTKSLTMNPGSISIYKN